MAARVDRATRVNPRDRLVAEAIARSGDDLITEAIVSRRRACPASRRRRARQNVMFELGYFYGAIGRSRVAVLYERGVQLPSDMKGVGWLALDVKGSWKAKLAKELRHAKIDVDLNKAV